MKRSLTALLVLAWLILTPNPAAAVCGWVLLVAPLRATSSVHDKVEDKYDIRAPFPLWLTVASYDTAKECEKDKSENLIQVYTSAPQVHTEADKTGRLWVAMRMYRCLPFDALSTLPK